MEICREITSLTQNDCYIIFNRDKHGFDFPLHFHSEIEINLLINAGGAQRIIGDNVDVMSDAELVVVGSNLPHGWFDNGKSFTVIKEVTLQFNPDVFGESLLRRNRMAAITKFLDNSRRGILYSCDTVYKMSGRFLKLSETSNPGFDSFIEFISIINELAEVPASQYRLLSSTSFGEVANSSDSRRIEKVFDFINKNYQNKITLTDAARIANMTEVAFSRFIKTHTGVNFIDSLHNVRLGHVCRMLVDTSMPVSEIAYSCGFNNMANFNRIFLKKKGVTPSEFREIYANQKKYI